MDKWGSPILFMLSVNPNPVVDFVGISAGVLRYPLKSFLVIV